MKARFNKDATITISTTADELTGKVSQRTLDEIKKMSQDPKWIAFMEQCKNTEKEVKASTRSTKRGRVGKRSNT